MFKGWLEVEEPPVPEEKQMRAGKDPDKTDGRNQEHYAGSTWAQCPMRQRHI